MNEIRIGKIIASHRREKGVTQEELAKHLGVSKPAVSKWESGQSYPDILLLPLLAAYFDISVDQLLGYEPQLTKQDIRKVWERMKRAFVNEPFDKVYGECEDYLRKYFSCWELQFQIGLLYVNHCNLTGSQEGIERLLKRSLEIFERVEKETQEVGLAKMAIHMQAVCYLSLREPQACIDILESLAQPMMNTESMLVKAYQMKGDREKAMEYLQGYSYINLITLLSSSTDYFLLNSEKPEKTDLYYQLFTQVCKLFEVEELHPAVMINLYLMAARSYTLQGNLEKAMDVLEEFLQLVRKNENTTFTLHGNRIFDTLDAYFTTVDIETTAPRGVEFVWKDIRVNVLKDPAYAALEGEERFQRIKRHLMAE